MNLRIFRDGRGYNRDSRPYPVAQNSYYRFLVAGTSAVAVDAAGYSLFLAAGFQVDFAKGLGLSLATVFAYFVNRNWTFRAYYGGLGQMLGFVALYVSAIGLNVGVNRLMIDLTGENPIHLAVAWFTATAMSSTWNYLGMRCVVFRRRMPS